MRNRLVYARERARKERERLGGKTGVLLLRLRESLVREYDLELVGVDSERFLQGSRGELVLAEGCLYYDRTLEQRPEELLEVLAHEYCHLLLHHEQFRAASQDLIRGSAFLNNGAAALSRYSPRSQYEAEASAFAAEFICPSRECFLRWRETEGLSAETLAGEFGATPSLLRLQLAEGLYESVAAEVESDTDKRLEPPVTSEQESAATALGIPVLVDAGPGTGKTKTLVRRVEYLVKEKGVEPEKILVLTFSNEAAGELQERLRTCLGDEAASRMAISTFHGFGVALLNTLGHHAGLGVDFSLLDETSQQELISELLGSVDCDSILNIKKPEETAAEATRSVNFLKDRLIGVAELRLAISAWTPTTDEQNEYARSQALLRIFDLYETEKAKRQQVDFADLIRMPHELLQANEKLREQVQSDFPWVLVDEYQDVSRATALLLRQICTTGNPPWVVGDARQAIYRFRGAAPENVRLFAKDFPGAVTFQLSENYRSCPEVIAVMNRMATWLEEEIGRASCRERV